MGSKLSIDKQVSELDDILAMNPSHFKKIRFESKSPQETAHNLKVRLPHPDLALQADRQQNCGV
jgi:hypothetical protein